MKDSKTANIFRYSRQSLTHAIFPRPVFLPLLPTFFSSIFRPVLNPFPPDFIAKFGDNQANTMQEYQKTIIYYLEDRLPYLTEGIKHREN